MSDEASFLKAIRDKPGERSTRLVYADWLDEHDRSREAEFLRLQIQAAESNTRLFELGGQLDAKWLHAIKPIFVNSDSFTLLSGREIRLDVFRQSFVYAGLLEGLPTREINQRLIERLRTQERECRGELPYLIDPPERLIQYEGDQPYRFGTPAAIPGVECIGQFTSFQPARGANRDGSHLTIIWFQDEWAFPIDPGMREQIRAIDWEQHAHDFDW